MKLHSNSFPSFFPDAVDTIAAVSTAPGRGAIAVLRLSGPAAHEIAARCLDPWKFDERRCYLSRLRDSQTGALIDRPVVTVYHGPRSYTGEDTVEFSLHGGLMVPALSVAALLHAGAREAHAGEFTRRAVANGKLDLLQAEAVGDLIDAQSGAMHHGALAQLEGSLSRRISRIRQQLLHLESLVAYDIDFPEEDEGPISPQRVEIAIDELTGELDGLLRSARTGELLHAGALVVIAGPPNAGKSSLFNSLAGRKRAIVTDVPGTTRDALEVMIDVNDWSVRLIDTAGLRTARDVLEQMGIEVSEQYLSEANYVLACGETREGLIKAIAHVRRVTTVPIIPIWTKADLRIPPGIKHEPDLLQLDLEQGDTMPAISISVETGWGIAQLLTCLGELLSKLYAEMTVHENAILTRERHRRSVQEATNEISTFAQRWREGEIPMSIVTIHLKSAERALEEMMGRVDAEDVLDNLFRTFCVGK